MLLTQTALWVKRNPVGEKAKMHIAIILCFYSPPLSPSLSKDIDLFGFSLDVLFARRIQPEELGCSDSTRERRQRDGFGQPSVSL